MLNKYVEYFIANVRYKSDNLRLVFYKAIFDWYIEKKVIKNNKGLGICYGQALMKISHKMFIANPIGMFLVEIPGSPKLLGLLITWINLLRLLWYSDV